VIYPKGVLHADPSIPPMGIESNGDQLISDAMDSAPERLAPKEANAREKAVSVRANLPSVLTRIGGQSRGVLL
jgi:hypothetical protein